MQRKSREAQQTRPNFQCPGEGFYPDSRDCKIFYRCVLSGSQINPIQFECGPGTVFDPATSVCNHPYATSRVECGGVSPADQGNSQGGDFQQSTSPPPFTYPPQQTNQSSPDSAFSNSNVSSGIGDYCYQEGFLGDSNDCRKFYRCVNNGQNGLNRYEFYCAEGTVWDVDAIACNYPWLVRRAACSQFSQGQYPQQGTGGSPGGAGLYIRRKEIDPQLTMNV